MRNARGFTVLEISVTIGILLVALAVGMSAWAQSRQQRLLLDRRAAAREALLLTLERLRAANAAQLPPDGQKKIIALPPQTDRLLRGASCEIEALAEPPGLRRIRVSVKWNDTYGPESGDVLVRAEATQ
ncbi:MAG TPA: type II secretion system protein [Planctomycetota bacterium]|nr:type II secretion system protein [Planctomycetota bacterium]